MQYLPGEHSVQDVAFPTLNVPLMQSLIDDTNGFGHALPASQPTHDVAPATEYVPIGHNVGGPRPSGQ